MHVWEVLRRCMWFATFCPLKVAKSREPVKYLTLFYTLLQITIHEFGASWNRRSSKKAISVCALFCVRGHSEVCSIPSIDVLLLKATCLDTHTSLCAELFVWEWIHFRTNQTHFHMKGFTQRLLLKQTQGYSEMAYLQQLRSPLLRLVLLCKVT